MKPVQVHHDHPIKFLKSFLTNFTSMAHCFPHWLWVLVSFEEWKLHSNNTRMLVVFQKNTSLLNANKFYVTIVGP
jgi:hypothetical protein